jgi:type IX secretion system PorP/SprF family membrane protein
MFRRIIFYSFFTLISYASQAQDPQFSQYYNAPLYLNPAFTGTGTHSRVGLNYRNQWTGTTSPFITYSVFADHNFEPKKIGLGVLIKKDRQASGGLTANDLSVLGSYRVDISDKLTFRPGLQASFVTKDANFNSFTFGDQYDNNGLTGSGSIDYTANKGVRFSYLDFSAGGLLYSKAFWIGAAVNHLNRPKQSFNHRDFPLPPKISIHGGYNFLLKKQRFNGYSVQRSIIPTFNYRHQGLYDQLDLGVYALYDPIMFGIWYRGIPVKHYQPGFSNNEALVFMVGLHYNGLSIGYSYDFTISRLTPASGGSHEISLIYEWRYPYRKRIGRPLPCPKFYND